MSTTAKVKYRNYVPFSCFAIEFCNVSFYGDNSCKLNTEWDNIEFRKSHVREGQIEELIKCKTKLNDAINKLHNKKENVKRKFFFFKTQEEKDLENKICVTKLKIYSIDNKIKELNDDKFYGTIELEIKARKFIENHGFVLDSSNSCGEECTTTEIWKLN